MIKLQTARGLDNSIGLTRLEMLRDRLRTVSGSAGYSAFRLDFCGIYTLALSLHCSVRFVLRNWHG